MTVKIRNHSIAWQEEDLIKILPTNSNVVFMCDYTPELLQCTQNINWRVENNYLRGYKKNKCIRLHHLILPPKKGYLVDHINRKTNDNRCANLRYLTNSESGINRKISVCNTSGYTGVHWHKRKKRWCAGIKVNGKKLDLGGYISKELAHEAYVKAEEKYFPNIRYETMIR